MKVPEHIQYKLGTTVYRCLQNKALSYLVAACTLVADVASRQHLCSASRHQLVVPRHRCTTLGRWAFSVAGPMAWNALPLLLILTLTLTFNPHGFSVGHSSSRKSYIVIPIHHIISDCHDIFVDIIHRYMRVLLFS